MTRARLEAGLSQLGLEVSAGAVDGLLGYTELLKEWSGTYNLVARRDRKNLLERHILDSLSIAPWLQGESLLDVGTGAGLPGLPLAIIRPEMAVSLLDGTRKKILFIRHVKRTLCLDNINPLQQRVELLESGKAFSNITSRAFGSLLDFAVAVRSCTDAATRMLAMKGAHPGQELKELPAWVKVHSVEQLAIPGLRAERHLVIMSTLNRAIDN